MSSWSLQEQMSLLSDVKLAAQILSLVILIITLVLVLLKIITKITGAANQQLPGDNHADNIQMIAVNVNPV